MRFQQSAAEQDPKKANYRIAVNNQPKENE